MITTKKRRRRFNVPAELLQLIFYLKMNLSQVPLMLKTKRRLLCEIDRVYLKTVTIPEKYHESGESDLSKLESPEREIIDEVQMADPSRHQCGPTYSMGGEAGNICPRNKSPRYSIRSRRAGTRSPRQTSRFKLRAISRSRTGSAIHNWDSRGLHVFPLRLPCTISISLYATKFGRGREKG
ncbi:hypothetical protein EVAR_33409_1 [Eumeta japonica]|uniref:Uncharacterized protein n=1 Tax=Eumeta variegata TaxID=151549 RepID=A0A4C1W352_EUMVA|nr:hypothetical protein EVAR_33409_1 [Eumeta japonica]